MTLYQVSNWQLFENNKSRERDRCSFVCLPNKQDGLGLLHILSLPDGAAVFGIWTLVVQACSRQPKPRAGWLTVDGQQTGTPWALDDMALRWRRSVSEIERMIQVTTHPKVGWLIQHGVTQVPADGQQVPVQCLGRKEGKEGEGREAPPPPDHPSGVGQQDSSPEGEHVRLVLEELVLKAGPTEVREWHNAAIEAGSKSELEDQVFLRWAVRRMRKEVNVRFARDIAPMMRLWPTVGRAACKRLLEGEKDEEAADVQAK